MKLLIYGLNYTPEPTGIGKYTGEMAAWLAKQGYHVETICGLPHYPRWELDPDYADGASRVEELDGVHVERATHYVPSPEKLGAKARIWLESSFTLSAARYWLPRFFQREKPDVVIAASPPLQIGIWPLLYGWIRRVPWVLHVQDLQVDAAFRLGLLKSGLFGRLLYRIEAYLLRRATRVSTITPAMQARIIDKGMPSEWVWLCPNWADISAIRPSAKHNSFRLGLGVGDDALLVLYAGNMGEKQGLEMVLEAASKCRNDPRLLFLMVGDGGARRRLADLSKKMELQNVRFLPLQPKERLNDMLSAGDIHLVVQKRDAADLVMPSKLTNILAAGRACIATADPGTALHDVVSGYEAGCVVPPGDTDALADAVVKLACDPAMRQFCGRNAREYAEMNLDKDRILSGYAKQLKSLCN